MALTLLRHTTPKAHEGVCYGRTDLELSSTFEDEAAAAIALLAPPRRVRTSPLSRCRRLAERVASHFDAPLEVDPDLIEMDFGAWEGRLWADIAHEEVDQWAADFMDARPHGGETVRELWRRSRRALQHLEDALIVTHAGVIKSALAHEEGRLAFATNVPFGGAVTPIRRPLPLD